MTEHINKQFDQDLEAIRSRMLQMGGLVESQIRDAIAAFLDVSHETWFDTFMAPVTRS